MSDSKRAKQLPQFGTRKTRLQEIFHDFPPDVTFPWQGHLPVACAA
jgi:hypothetical protein